MIHFKNRKEKDLNKQIMEKVDQRYDEKEKMLIQWRGEHGYHSTLVNQMVHSTHESISYAYELMNKGTDADFQRAFDILRKVVPLQDRNPDNDTYGIWSYFSEEPLEQMAPPDWNWADFNGKRLLQISIDYQDKIPADLRELLHQSILHCCNSIIRRNMGPHYTNISIMGALVTLTAGEYYQEQYLIDYGKKRLKTLCDFNLGHGAFQEYNSPSYTWVVIDDLASMVPYISDSDCLNELEAINDLAWKCIAQHFHYRTKQWAGPHSRFYSMLEDTQLLMRIQRALNYEISLVSLEEQGLFEHLPMGFFSSDGACPECYKYYFTEPNQEAQVDAVFLHGQKPSDHEIAVCYQSEAFNLGTFYKANFWNQRRNHLSYFGTEQEPIYCGLKCLHDFYDYSSGLIVTAQDRARTLSITGFGTNGGDTHGNLDMVKNATILASDLRLRFEIGGAVQNVSIEKTGDNCFLAKIADVKVRITFPYGRFGAYPVVYETGEEVSHVNETGGHKDVAAVKYVDAVFYHGDAANICFTSLEECCCVISFEIISEGEGDTSLASIERRDGILTVCQGNLKVEAPMAACTMEGFKEHSFAYRHGKEYLELYCRDMLNI